MAVSAIVIGLHKSGWLLSSEVSAMGLLAANSAPRTWIGESPQFLLVALLSFGVGFATLTTTRRVQLTWIVAALCFELIGATWVGSLYHISFQPLLTLLAVALSFGAAIPLAAFLAREPSPPRVRREQPQPLDAFEPVPEMQERTELPAPLPKPEKPAKPEKRLKERILRPKTVAPVAVSLPGNISARAFEATAVVCDLADKHDLAEECEPEIYARITEKFLAHAVETLTRAGAYIESASGEGVVALFGFPKEDLLHAEQATREAMGLVESFTDLPESEHLNGMKIGVHAGVSSGRIMASAAKGGAATMLTTGEPVELARRFCIANRFYGSRVLMGPRTFELASKTLVARPIDFLGGVDVRERHEIYEPISLAVDADPDEIARRDEFWNGVVLYREKRWAEAYAHFQKARRADRDNDAPLQLYLRRLEPLALQLTNAPLDE